MKVFKFGGASVNSVERIRKISTILAPAGPDKKIVIISAMGKTTNALEAVTEAFCKGNKEEALSLFENIKQQHLQTAKYLLVTHYLACESQLRNFFTEVEWMLHDQPVREYDYYYDQIVCTGELLSTTIVSAYLNEIGISNTWVDIRDIFRTDDDFRAANIDWEYTKGKVLSVIGHELNRSGMVITQGFIGATDENESTTLGREGSDYSAAVFANMLDADHISIWKDVESVMNADPKQFVDAIPIVELNYAEAIEMAYYGAQVIHPKTIKPLQNKGIPLYVKCFIRPELPGTVIHNKPVKNLPPIIVLKENQVLIEMVSRDYSFMGEQHMGHVYQLLESLHLRPNLTQIRAISFLCVLDEWTEKIDQLAHSASGFLDIRITRGLTLLTIRHFNDQVFEDLTKGKKILIKQQTLENVQVLMQASQQL